MGKGFVVALTRKNYRWFAAWMARNGINGLAEIELIEYFESDNYHFDRDKFKLALHNHRSDMVEYNRNLIERMRNGILSSS